MKQVDIYTDGACSGNPGPGGWGVVLMYNGRRKEWSGAENQTTNNRMELTAVIESLRKLKEPCKVNLYSDSSYVINAFQRNWLDNWKNNGWMNSKKQPVINQDLWMELLESMKPHQVKYIKVKGHSDNEWNNRCDFLAREAINALEDAKR